jgi:hypothetical protein
MDLDNIQEFCNFQSEESLMFFQDPTMATMIRWLWNFLVIRTFQVKQIFFV